MCFSELYDFNDYVINEYISSYRLTDHAIESQQSLKLLNETYFIGRNKQNMKRVLQHERTTPCRGTQLDVIYSIKTLLVSHPEKYKHIVITSRVSANKPIPPDHARTPIYCITN